MKKKIIIFCAAGFLLSVACDNQAIRDEETNEGELNDRTDTTSYGNARTTDSNQDESDFGRNTTTGDYDKKTGPTTGGVSAENVEYTENDLPENIREDIANSENVIMQSARSYMRDGRKFYEIILEEKDTSVE